MCGFYPSLKVINQRILGGESGHEKEAGVLTGTQYFSVGHNFVLKHSSLRETLQSG